MASRPDGGATLNLYCIDINTDTWGGIGYALGTWDASNVPNVGYVARILNEYYPNTDQPALANDNETAAAVQAAIWFFSDRYVLNTSDPLHDAVAAITAKIINEGPLVQPPPPSLTITPATVSGPRQGARTVYGHDRRSRGSHRQRHGREYVRRPRRHDADRAWNHGAVRPEDLAALLGYPQRRAPGHLGSHRPQRQRLSLRRQHRRGQRRPEAHPGRERHLENHSPSHGGVSAQRGAGREEDDRRCGCRIARAGRDPRGL